MADKEAPENNVDPNVVMPPGVLAASARSDEVFKAAYHPEEVASKATNGEASPDETLKIVEETPPSADQTLEQQPQQSQPEEWERNFRAMKGRHDHLLSENRQMAQRLSGLEQTLATLAAKPADPQADPTLDQITPQEVNDYGEEFLNIIAKQAKNVLLPTINQIRQENAELKQQLGRVGTTLVKTEKVNLEGYLDQNLRNWRDLNYNQDFLDWLAEPDAYSGATRHNLLRQAYDRNDGPRVLAFFNGFLADEAATAPPVASAANGGGNGSHKPKVPLASLAAPGRARTTAQAPVEKPVIRRDQIAAFYAKVAAGDYSGNEAEKARLENMIFEAQREGRIT